MNNDVLVRLYQEEDRAQIQKICFVTGFEQALQLQMQESVESMLISDQTRMIRYCNFD